MQFFNGIGDGCKFFFLGPVNNIGVIFADHGLVGRNSNGFKPVYFHKFHSFRLGCASHARKFFIHAEIVLVGNAGEGLVFGFDFHLFLGFQGLVQTVAKASAFHGAAREFVDNDDFLIGCDHVIDIALIAMVGS